MQRIQLELILKSRLKQRSKLVPAIIANRIDALEAVSRVLARTIPLERQAFSLDSEKGEVQSIKRESLLSGYYRAALRREDMVVMQGGSPYLQPKVL
jgi:hypothetical protein